MQTKKQISTAVAHKTQIQTVRENNMKRGTQTLGSDRSDSMLELENERVEWVE